MLTAPHAFSCPICNAAQPPVTEDCPQCRASAEGRDRLWAVEFAARHFSELAAAQRIDVVSGSKIAHDYLQAVAQIRDAVRTGKEPAAAGGPPASDACANCGLQIDGGTRFCARCGSPADGVAATTLRYLLFVDREITRHVKDGRLAWPTGQVLQADIRNRMAELKRRVETRTDVKAVMPPPLPAGMNAEPPPVPSRAVHDVAPPLPFPSMTGGRNVQERQPNITSKRERRGLMEILLDSRTIHWMLMAGGSLLAVGLVIWLASLGVFRNPWVVAGTLGIANLACLGGGFAVIRAKRYPLAGRGLTLLACLVMPLNLWFYQRHGLMTIDGHLWLGALVCCAIYALAALVLEDVTFVYVFLGGVAMTGLLMLADMHRFQEIAAPAAWLVVLGVAAIHVHHLLTDANEGPFSRKQFGRAFFVSGHVVLGAGLALLLGGQLSGWFYMPLMRLWGVDGPPVIVSEQPLKLMATGLTLVGTYAYIYSSVVAKRRSGFIFLAALALIWSEGLAIELMHLGQHPGALLIVLALTALAINIGGKACGQGTPLGRAIDRLGLGMMLLAAVYGVALFLRSTMFGLAGYSGGWDYVAGLFVLAAAGRTSGWLSHRRNDSGLARVYVQLSVLSGLAAISSMLSMLGWSGWERQVPVMMLAPLAQLIQARLGGSGAGKNGWRSLEVAAHAVAGVLLLVALPHGLTDRLDIVVGSSANLVLALVAIEAAVFYAIASIGRANASSVYVTAGMLCGAAWQLMNYRSYTTETYVLVFAAIGLLLLTIARLAGWERNSASPMRNALSKSGRAVTTLALGAGMMLGLSRLGVGDIHWRLVRLLGGQTTVALLAAALVRTGPWRRIFVIAAGINGVEGLICLQALGHLSPSQKVEILLVTIGALLLITGHIEWYREQNRKSPKATFGLTFGSLLVGLPLLIASMVYRFGYQISTVNEIGLATAAVLLLLSGVAFELKSTAITGGTLLVLHLAMLLVSIGMQAQVAVGVYLAFGGAAIFAVGLLLSIHRDRLLQLPERIRRREGLFRVLAWR